MHDPTTRDRQGPDVGSQYRSAIYPHDADQEAAALASKQRLDASGRPAGAHRHRDRAGRGFYIAEENHQRFFEKRGMVRHKAPSAAR